MGTKKAITVRLAVALAVMAISTSGCDLLDAIIRGLEHYCALPEFVVNRTDDPARGGLCTTTSCSLRQAVEASNTCPGTQSVRLPAGTYVLSLAGSGEDLNRTGDLDITDSINISGEAGTVIDGGGIDRIFDVASPAQATLTSLTITHGSGVDGGGIRNLGTLTMTGGAIQDNQGRQGGGLFNQGMAALDSVSIQENVVDRGEGGGIYNHGNLVVTGGDISINSAPQGGGLYNAGEATLNRVSIRANDPHSGPGGTTSGVIGGGIYNTGTLTITGGGVLENRADVYGAGIFNDSAATLQATSTGITDNLLGVAAGGFGLPESEGAGLYNTGGATLESSAVSDNQAAGSRGGGIANHGNLIVSDTTLDANVALQGAGLLNAGTADVQGSTFSSNVASGGGGVAGLGAGIDNLYRASLTLVNSTLSGNRITYTGDYVLGAGLYNEGTADLSNVTVTANQPNGLYSGQPGIEGELEGPPAARLKNTLIAGNAASDCDGTTLLSLGHNLDGDGTCALTGAGDLPGKVPRLGALASNGGSTQTHALRDGSPAIDRGAACPSTDQRGFPRPRPAGGACDIGAYEYDPGNAPTPGPRPTFVLHLPMFTFTQQANCRQGPNTLYPALGYGQIGEQAKILGVSEMPGWYAVILSGGETDCWVASSTGNVIGSLDGLQIVVAPLMKLDVSNQVCNAKQYLVRLTWENMLAETGYRVYRDGALVATLGVDTTSYDDTPPDLERHVYYVEAFNASGFAKSIQAGSRGCVH
jgi:hypothetical protein